MYLPIPFAFGVLAIIVVLMELAGNAQPITQEEREKRKRIRVLILYLAILSAVMLGCLALLRAISSSLPG